LISNILNVEAVTVSLSGFLALNGLNFSMQRNELRCLVGPNGAGKTTLLDVITGKVKANQGRIIFEGNIDLTKKAEHKLVQMGIARKFQTPSIFASLTVYENLQVALGFRDRHPAFFQELSQEQPVRIYAMLGKIGLEDKAQKPAGQLSHGEKQWLEIGMLLIQQPKLLLLDEPVAGMTRQERDKTGILLQSIVQDSSVLVVEHDMQFVRQFASKVTVMHEGQKLCEGSVDEVQSDPRVIEVYTGRQRERQSLAVTTRN
jgi:urea transport system ATP-binding protein